MSRSLLPRSLVFIAFLPLCSFAALGRSFQGATYENLTTITGGGDGWLIETSIAAGPDSVMVVCADRRETGL